MTTHPWSTIEQPWGKVPKWVAADGLSKPAICLFIVMSSYAGGEDRRCWPSQETLAADLGWIRTSGLDRRRLRRHLDELIAHDLIRRAGRHTTNGVWTTQYIVAPFPVDADDIAPSPDAATTSPTSDPQAEGTMARNGAPDGADPDTPMPLDQRHKQTKEQTSSNQTNGDVNAKIGSVLASVLSKAEAPRSVEQRAEALLAEKRRQLEAFDRAYPEAVSADA